MMRLIFAVLGLVFAGAIFFLYTKPAYDGVQATQAQIAEYNAALDKATELQQLKQTLLSRYNALDPNALDRLQKMLPDHVDNISLILELDNLAGRYGMALANVDISSPQSTASTATPLGSIGASGQRYDSLTLRFSTRGSYDDFTAFLADLESSLRVVDLVSLSLSPGGIVSAQDRSGKKVSGPPVPIYNYDITLRTYWLK